MVVDYPKPVNDGHEVHLDREADELTERSIRKEDEPSLK